MRLLLDTHTLLWHREGSERLSGIAKSLLADADNQIFVSITSLWEISIKRSLGKLATSKTPAELLAIYQKAGAELLPISPNHVTAVESLPWHHRDPFDRMLIAQANTEGLTLVTKDEAFNDYDVNQIW